MRIRSKFLITFTNYLLFYSKHTILITKKAKMSIRFSLIFLCFPLFLFAQQPFPDSLYNDDPWQRLPIGQELAKYRIRSAQAGQVDQARVHPPSWWIGMENPELQILIYDKNIGDLAVRITYPGVELLGVDRVENKNYLFVNLFIGPGASPGNMNIYLEDNNNQIVQTYSYPLLKKNTDKDFILGFDASDFVYLLMPDRFANGDYGNDSFDDMTQFGINRDKVHFRHGGDLLGMMERLDYLEELGVTAVWPNPVLENDQPYDSYHGYAVTDHYEIDKRLGNNDQYRQFVQLCHQRGMKVIMDVIHNHVGDQHWFIKDLPSFDWIHQPENYEQTVYRAPVHMDPYGAESDKASVTDGWFDRHMPDLNHKNPLLATYLIQNHLWWIGYSGHDGYRIDTYAYCDQDFMAAWGKRMQEEFPKISMYAETWVHGSAVQAQFTQNNGLREGYNSHMPGVTDFQLHYAMMEALNQPQGWTSGISRMYYTLAKDFLYEDPYRNAIFLDNHDLSRLFSTLNKDFNKFKSGIALLLTMRGMPVMYYGTEILMTGSGGAFGEAGRIDFPGGWKEDQVDKFKKEGRNELEQAAFEYVKTLANYRKNTPALQSGQLTQYIPEDGIYVYFRHDDEKTVMVVYNTHDIRVKVNTDRYQERMLGFKKGKDVVTGATIEHVKDLYVDGKSVLVVELQ